MDEARNEVEKACDLIEECMRINGLGAQALVSACASIITTTLSQYSSPEPFYQIMHMMDFLYRKRREEEGKPL